MATGTLEAKFRPPEAAQTIWFAAQTGTNDSEYMGKVWSFVPLWGGLAFPWPPPRSMGHISMRVGAQTKIFAAQTGTNDAEVCAVCLVVCAVMGGGQRNVPCFVCDVWTRDGNGPGSVSGHHPCMDTRGPRTFYLLILRNFFRKSRI